MRNIARSYNVSHRYDFEACDVKTCYRRSANFLLKGWKRPMLNMPRAGAVATALFVTCWVSPERAHAETCESLSGRSLGNATITAATAVTPPFTIKDEIMDQQITVSVPFCRAQGTIKPSPDSDVRFELWLPQDSAWNGKYEGVGNGGFAGSISYHAMAWAVEAGYAASGTDTGHVAPFNDASWLEIIQNRLLTGRGGRFTRQQAGPRRSYKPTMVVRRRTRISVDARMAEEKR